MTLTKSGSSATLFGLSLHSFELLLRDEVQLGLHGKEQSLIRHLLLVFLLALHIGTFFTLRLLDSLFDLLLLDLLEPLFAHSGAPLLDIVALDDLVVPEVADLVLFVLLGLPQVHGHLLQVERAVCLVTIRHQLRPRRLVLILWLELKVGDSLGGQVHLNRWLVRLVIEVPNIDSVVLCDEDDSRSAGGEGTAGVLRAACVGRAEDRLFAVEQADLPNGEMEVVDGQEQIIIEGRPLEGQDGPRVALRLVDALHVLSGALLITLDHRADAPIDEGELAFVGSGPESGSGLASFE
mmetsp:Transcript_47835/g.63236  ORF Transcript_47835/g.63236 Transcript_47835/m.63236 type:complete len:294 (-) Transcript_47835:1438-2319(-)